MNTIRASLMACIGIAVFSASNANAAVDQYSVEAGGRATINLEMCSAESQLAVRGDTGTDLDFYLSNSAGDVVHTDEGVDDYLSVVVEKEADGCETYSLVVSNLGEEGNDFTVVLEPITESSIRVQKYIVQPGASQVINFRACGASAEVSARGDGDTDLDFIIRNSDGAVVHENDDLTDETTANLEALLSDCESFELEVANLGEVYNALMVVIEPQGVSDVAHDGVPHSTSLAGSVNANGARSANVAEQSGAGDYRAEASSAIQVNLPVCGPTRLEVRGDGDTDLDFSVANESGVEVHSDYDLSDVTFAMLEPGEGCETFALVVDNLGAVYNDFNIALIDPETRVGASGIGEYRVNARLSTKVALRVCGPTIVRAGGDGDTDLDFQVTDSDGSTVHENFDLTDKTEFTLDPGDSSCGEFQMKVDNLGDVYNLLTVDFGGASGAQTQSADGGAGPSENYVARLDSDANPDIATVSRPATSNSRKQASSDETDRSVSIINRSGEALATIFWSNSATLDWGDDKLGAGQILADGQQWNVDVFDGSNACLFDFRAVTEGARQIEVSTVNVCSQTDIVIE